MKNIAFYKILICIGLLWLAYSCEKSTDQTTTNKVAPNTQLTNREGDDQCEPCLLIDDCCCGIEMQNPGQSGNFPLRICGNDDGTTNCMDSPPSPCGTVSGGVIPFTLNTANPKIPFCMVPGGYFKITNTGGNNLIIKITCHYDIVNHTYTNVTVTPSNYYVYGVDTGCDIEECYHN